MKKSLRLFFGATIAVSAAAVAQPTLTASGSNMVVGDQLVQSTANAVSPGSAGASQTWNLSSMTTAGTETISVVTPGSTTNGTSYPSANVAAQTSAATAYYNANSSSFQNYGAVAGGVVITYSNPEDLMHYPFTFNNTYSDTWGGQFVASGFTVYRAGTTTVTADGHGTVTTPSGTYPNSLRVHLQQSYKDSSNIFGTPVLNTYTNDQYMWFDNNRHLAVASVYTLTSVVNGGAPSTSSGGTFFGNPVGISSHSAFAGSVKIYPNPATLNLAVNIELERAEPVELKVFNSLGEEVGAAVSAAGVAGENVYRLDVGKFSEGIYFVQVRIAGALSATRRFVISR
jgi:hypothetical protein